MPKPSTRPTAFRPGLNVQLLLFTVFPLAVLLLVFAFGSVFVHQREMRRMVGERDEIAVRAVASALGTEIDHRIAEVRGMALRADMADDPKVALFSYQELFTSFDAGAALFAADGQMLASAGDSSFWRGSGNTAESLTGFPKQGMVSRTIQTADSLLVVVGAASSDGRLIALGVFSLHQLFEQVLSQALPSDQAISLFLVDGERTLLYQHGDLDFEGTPADHPGVSEALAGQSGTTYITIGGSEHVVSYSPVSPPGWALVMEEPWEAVVNPILNTSQIGPLVIAPLLLVTLVGLWFGARQIVQPLQQLESKAARLAWGNFDAIEEPVEGIAEIRRLQSQLVEMAHKVQSAQQGLHDYIAAITSAQEEERRRLARELHDDTLQALIALKQRLQLAERIIKDKPSQKSLREVQALTEETINNLRRFTRALRPIYLEDLGLIPALEMLVHEAGQNGRLSVQFQCHGEARRLDSTVELALYRMAQEVLSNVVRHAQASHAVLTIAFKAKAVVMEVSDNGVGFEMPGNPGEFAAQGHFGLLGLRERAELVGARLEIQSIPGQGTHITVSIED